jgi:hypothetical protein
LTASISAFVEQVLFLIGRCVAEQQTVYDKAIYIDSGTLKYMANLQIGRTWLLDGLRSGQV